MLQWKRRMWLDVLLSCCLGGIALTMLIGAQASDTYPLTVMDAQRHNVQLNRRPERIISLAPSVTEILFAIGAGDRVVADTSYCKYPAKAASLAENRRLPRSGQRRAWWRLKPDLVIAARGTRNDILDHLRALGVTLLVVDADNLDGVSRLDQTHRSPGRGWRRRPTAWPRNWMRAGKPCGKRRHGSAPRSAPTTLFLFSWTISTAPGRAAISTK